jgi:hypothetical protein
MISSEGRGLIDLPVFGESISNTFLAQHHGTGLSSLYHSETRSGEHLDYMKFTYFGVKSYQHGYMPNKTSLGLPRQGKLPDEFEGYNAFKVQVFSVCEL